ncbi:CRISPR-associated protein DevR [Carbonactinospora thermoautotrophica]|uniref:CRISPR-associated protein DevR n=1 Tax=Carbonactinospora thermoautotrophica TaxID=1469144 RepID=A0A132N6Y5_9ACTN|nr:type I-B CRISPR-associated protein Cas7/Cst2/DevR [Carbonactinospora thermoautotrophica]KWX05889.1 CRISPR-associated protein DevR [Carbonactinospora thermoautotrophica]KWX09072.1 CRISPR-associated protein DevR [Carbonactinospora thermoautotrophica]
MSFLVGKVALDIDAGAPNNGRGEDNVARVKQLRIGRDVHPYVSAQAFRRWLRDSLPAEEPRSPVTRSGSGARQQAYTAGRPDKFLDDDLFGYMVAVKGGGTCQRDTVLATGTLVSVVPQRPTVDFGTMSRGFAAGENPVIHEHELYTAELAGDILLDLPRVGVFETDGSGLKVALTAEAAKEAEAAGAERTTFRGVAALRLPVAERRRRVALLLRTLAAVRGGAKQALHYGDRAPALVLLAPVKGGVNPFTRVLTAREGRAVFDTDVLREEIEVWADELDGPVLLGWAPGFLGDQREDARAALADLIEAGRLVLDHPRVVLHRLAGEIERGERDDWFEDPKA